MSPASIQTLAFIYKCSHVQGRMQVPVPLFTSSIAWLEANMFITVYGHHLLMRCISWKTTNVVNTLWTIGCSNIRKEDAHIKREVDNKHHLNNKFIKSSHFDIRHLNKPRRLFPSFCCTTQCIFEPLRVYEPCFNTDKYGIYMSWTQRGVTNTSAIID